MYSTLCTLLALLTAVEAFLPSQNPPWPSSYAMNQSTISMFCNSSGFFDPVLSSRFGIASFDWSNAKAVWAATKPMNTGQLLLQQARLTKAQGTQGRLFLYFNLVKALPWFEIVREKLVDPAYSDFFLPFSPSVTSPHVPPCDLVTGQCSALYHDQLQTPSVPVPGVQPDGACVDYCDCGAVPCAEYVWNHKNESLRQFLVDVVTGPSFLGADGGTLVSGLFIDDFWCSNLLNGTGACGDPAQGPTEMDPHNQADMGLSDADVRDQTLGWLDTTTRVQAAILAAGGYTWSLLPGQSNANADPLMLHQGQACAAAVRAACSPAAPWQAAPLLMGLTPGNASTGPLPHLQAEVAAFLLMRGPHAYLGWGQWGLSWPVGFTWNTTNGTVLPLPEVLGRGDWGEPSGLCQEVPAGAGSFVRTYAAGTVRLDCSSYDSEIPPY